MSSTAWVLLDASSGQFKGQGELAGNFFKTLIRSRDLASCNKNLTGGRKNSRFYNRMEELLFSGRMFISFIFFCIIMNKTKGKTNIKSSKWDNNNKNMRA